MQFTLPSLLAALAATASAVAIPSGAIPVGEKMNITTLAANKAFSVSEWTDKNCRDNQQTWVLNDKKCYEPSHTSWSMEIWYLDPGCKLGLYHNYCGDDKNIAWWNPPTYQCIDLTGVTHYQLYC